MHSLVYIAGPFFTFEQKDAIEDIEDLLDARDIKFFSPREYGIITSDTNMSKERTQRIFDMNIRMIEACDTMIAVTDNFDPGTMFEIGAFHSQQESYGYEETCLITYSPKQYGSNVMIAQAAFTHARSIEELGLALHGHQIDELEAIE